MDALAEIGAPRPDVARIMADSRSCWPVSHGQVLDDAASLHGCLEPSQLEDAVCDLLGRHWRDLYEEHDAGLAPQEWLEGLLHAAEGRAGEPGVRRLVYGIGLIATPGLAGLAVNMLRRAPAGLGEAAPAWLGASPVMTASSDLLLLRDTYGLRFGLLARVTGPTGQGRTYLFDVDLCHGFPQVLGSGYHRHRHGDGGLAGAGRSQRPGS